MLLSLQDFMADNFYTPSSDNYAAPGPQGYQLSGGIANGLCLSLLYSTVPYSTTLHSTYSILRIRLYCIILYFVIFSSMTLHYMIVLS